MSEQMGTIQNEAAKMLLLTCFAEAWQQVFAADSDSSMECRPKPAEAQEPLSLGEPMLFSAMRLRGTLHGGLKLSMTEQDGTAVLMDPSSAGTEDLNTRWRRAIERVAGALPKRAADASRFAFSVEPCRDAASAAHAIALGAIELRDAGKTVAWVHIAGDEELMSSLQVSAWNPRHSERETAAQLERVIDVPLAVTLRFGQRQMRLREVLELNTGSLVELDRQVEEPVDLLLGERVIARGEVVIVDGNYGLRVTEIVESRPMSLL